MAIVKLKTAPEIEIGKVDHSLTVWGNNKTKIGELVFSKGSVEWWPKGNKVNAHKYTWAKFAKALEASDAERVVPVKKAAAKKAVKAAPAAPAKKRAAGAKKA